MKLNEVISTTIRLTTHQKSIMATIAQSGDKRAPDDILAANTNLSGALKQLVMLKMVTNTESDLYSLTDLGRKYANDANIIDDTGELTDEGTAALIQSGRKEPISEAITWFRGQL